MIPPCSFPYLFAVAEGRFTERSCIGKFLPAVRGGLFIPRGFAHGFVVLSEEAVFQYKCDEFYHPESEGGIAWDDPDLAIDWRIPESDVKLSKKDMVNPLLKDIDSPFDFNVSLY